eukprot:8371378-Pyramimonas_sp.AAC.1
MPVLGKLRAAVVNSGKPTCRVGKVRRALDYFVVSHDLAGEVRACVRREDSSNRTHYPVSLRLGDDGTSEDSEGAEGAEAFSAR